MPVEAYATEWPQFYTATISKWRALLAQDADKQIIVDCLKFLVANKRVTLNAFVIMNNHIHLVWQVRPPHSYTSLQSSFMKFTGRQIARRLEVFDSALLEELKVKNHDRAYQIWKRESLSVELFSRAVFLQKLEYIHNNPVRKGWVENAEEYKWSSASFYKSGIDPFGILSFYD